MRYGVTFGLGQVFCILPQGSRLFFYQRGDNAALQKSEERYRSLLEVMIDPVYICSPDYRVEYANPAMTKRTGRDIVGEYCFKALHGFKKKCSWCVHHMIQQGKSFDHEIRSPKDGHFFYVSQSPIVHDDGSISKMTVYRDTTDFKKIESQLVQAQKIAAIGVLAGGIAHDFNNILFPIVGFAEMLREDLPENSELHKNIDMILEGANRAKDLVKQILTFSRQAEQDIKPLKPHLIIEEVAKLILLVDDEKSVLLIEQMILERLGYKVECKRSSIDALEAVKTDPDAFDLIISDMTMPNMTGDQLARKIMEIKPTLPIIICTGFSERISLEKLRSIGVKALLIKPFIKSTIATTVRKVIDEAMAIDTR